VRSVVRESFALSSSRDAFGVSNDSERAPASLAGALEVFTAESLTTYKQPTATPLDHV